MADDAKKKVLFVIGSLGKGGTEHQMVMLIEGLARHSWKCEVFVLDSNGPLRARLEAIGVPIHTMAFDEKAARARNIIKLLRAPFRLTWIAMRSRPDVIHAYLPLTNFIGAFAGRLAFVPLIITSRRGLGMHQERRPYWSFFDRMSNTFSTIVTCNSMAVGLDTVRRDGIDRNKLVLIRNGLVCDEFDEARNTEEIRAELSLARKMVGIVTVGNLIRYKGHSDLLDALSRLRTDSQAFKVYVIGRDDGIGEELKEKALKLGFGEKVVFLGARSDVPRLLSAMNLFVLPSHEEGSSNALLEAMASGLPIVATDAGGNAESLDFGRLGVLVPARDPTALANAIQTFLDNMDTGIAMGKDASKYVRLSYGAEVMVQSYIKLYFGDRSASLI